MRLLELSLLLLLGTPGAMSWNLPTPFLNTPMLHPCSCVASCLRYCNYRSTNRRFATTNQGNSPNKIALASSSMSTFSFQRWSSEDDQASPRSIREILKELDERNIRYSPTATRLELEQLLLLHVTTTTATTITTTTSVASIVGDSDDQKNTTNFMKNYTDLPKTSTVRRSNYHTTDDVFEEQSTTIDSGNDKYGQLLLHATQRNRPLTLQDILLKLDQRQIRYGPSCTREELEDLLLNDEKQRQQREQQKEEEKEEQEPRPSLPGNDRKHVPLDDYDHSIPINTGYENRKSTRATNQQDDDQINIPDATAASRNDMERRLREYKRRQRRRKQSAVQPRNVWERVVQRGQNTILNPSLATRVVDHATQAVYHVNRTARRAKRKLVDFVAVDEETGIRDVEYQYLHKTHDFPTITTTLNGNSPIDVTAVPLHDDEPHDESDDSPSQFSKYHAEKYGDSNSGETMIPSSSPDPPFSKAERFNQSKSVRPKRRQNPRAVQTTSLPPLQSLESPRGARTKATTGSSSNPPKNSARKTKKIYSPYGDNSNAFDNKDIFDRLGEFFVSTADTLLWGDDGANGDQNYNANVLNQTSHGKRRHWKDRLEERLDFMMGMHNNADASYYERWAQRRKSDQLSDDEVADKYSFSRKNRQGDSRSRKKVYERPIWEEEGNLFSLLLGKSRRGDPLLFQNILDQRKGSIIKVLGTLTKTFLVLGSYLCRWASVQGCLPQPVVVMAVATAGICCEKRLRAMAITLLAIRAVGELLHGSLYGNDGWDDDDDAEDDTDSEQPPDGE